MFRCQPYLFGNRLGCPIPMYRIFAPVKKPKKWPFIFFRIEEFELVNPFFYAFMLLSAFHCLLFYGLPDPGTIKPSRNSLVIFFPSRKHLRSGYQRIFSPLLVEKLV